MSAVVNKRLFLEQARMLVNTAFPTIQQIFEVSDAFNAVVRDMTDGVMGAGVGIVPKDEPTK